MVSDEYLAGLFDGEGFIELRITTYSDQGRRAVCAVGLGMQNEDLPNLFRQRFGGAVYPYTDKRGKTKWTWKMSGTKAKEAFTIFSQHCRLKDKEAYIALEMVELLYAGKQGCTKVSNEIWSQRQTLVDRRNQVRSEL